uniref:Uncharacterized protein n=1 Tax=Anopheles epiroticus TaxID=199890 RepID=A0A182PVI7_9DIPT
MASKWNYRGLTAGPLVLSVLYCCATFQWPLVMAEPFYYPPAYYYSTKSWNRPIAGSYGYYQQPSTAAESQNVAVYSAVPNYYGADYEDYQSTLSREKALDDPYLRTNFNNYARFFYYPTARIGDWRDINNGAKYYNSKRRQDSVLPAESKPETTTKQRPRKKKLFVPNVWG